MVVKKEVLHQIKQPLNKLVQIKKLLFIKIRSHKNYQKNN